jgi:hypothetical protein
MLNLLLSNLMKIIQCLVYSRVCFVTMPLLRNTPDGFTPDVTSVWLMPVFQSACKHCKTFDAVVSRNSVIGE